MAYTLLHNTPLVGQISWSDVDIIYDGVSYPVADGSTDAKFAYWQIATPNTMMTGNSYPLLGEEDCLVFINNGGVGLSSLDSNIIDGSMVVPGTIMGNAIMAEAIAAGHIAADTIIGDHVVAGTLTGDHIAANSITAGEIDSRGLTIKDDLGNVLFGVGTNLNASYVDGIDIAVQGAVGDVVADAVSAIANYEIEVESTNGDVFRPGQAMTTTLKAHVFKNGVEVTDELQPSAFRWRRVSYFLVEPPNDDATWNALYASGYKQIEVTTNAVTSRATFHCDITL